MSECSLVHEPCRRPEKIGGLAQVLQRRTPTWGDRPTDADNVAESRWRSQPATVKEAGNSTCRRSKVRPHCRGQPDSKQHLSRIWWHSRLRGLPQSLERRPTAAAAFAL